MDIRKELGKYRKRILTEAWIRASVMGLAVGFIVAFVAALTLWIVDPVVNLWWLSLIALFAGAALASIIFFFAHYRPTLIKSARRIDRVGLEERLITMVEFENDDSYMAKIQRQDAIDTLRTVVPSSIAIAVSTFAIVFLLITAILGSGMITVSTLSAFGIIPDFSEIVEEIIPPEPEVYIAVTYETYGEGYILGEPDQLVLLGGSTEPVEAIPEDGYEFMGWDDGYQKTVRSDGNVTEECIYIAIFAETGEGEGPGEDEGAPGDDGAPSDKGAPGNTSSPDSDQTGEAGGGKYEEANQIIDGKTYYREVLGGYQDAIRQYLEEYGETLTDEEREILESYIGIV